MANSKTAANKAFSFIHTAQTILEKYPSMEALEAGLRNDANSTITFLLNILRELGQYDRIVQWLSDYIVYAIPGLEVAVKGLLLANLKIACSVDPMIPLYMRKRPADVPYDSDDVPTRGIPVNLQALDYMSILQTSPFSLEGRYNYFGVMTTTEEKILQGGRNGRPVTITKYTFAPAVSLYSLARAEDFNAFLWFAINKGRLPVPSGFETVEQFNSRYNISATASLNLLKSGTYTCEASTVEDSSTLLQGVTMFQKSGEYASSVMSMCINSVRDENGFITASTVVPVSDNWKSLNWYVNPANYYVHNLGIDEITGKKRERDYSKEMAICNLEYIRQTDIVFQEDTTLGQIFDGYDGAADYYFNFTILPKPYIIVPGPIIVNSRTKYPVPREILFDADGNEDTNGKYSIDYDTYEVDEHGNVIDLDGNAIAVLKLDENSIHYSLDKALTTDDDSLRLMCLREVYRGLTVYEFNYDFVMGMRLYDAKVITSQLIAAVLGFDFGITLTKNTTQLEAEAEIIEIMREVLRTEDETVSDCYYSFSNRKYDELTRQAEIKRAHLYPLNFNPDRVKYIDGTKFRNILDEFDDAPTLHAQSILVTRAINEVIVSVTEGSVGGTETDGLKMNVVCNLIESLMSVLMNALISPKIALLIQVNQELMGNFEDNIRAFNVKQFIMLLKNFFVSLARELIEQLTKELLNMVLDILKELFENVSVYVLKEMYEAYREMLEAMIEACGGLFSLSINHGTLLDTQIPDVRYADIDPGTGEIIDSDNPYIELSPEDSVDNC